MSEPILVTHGDTTPNTPARLGPQAIPMPNGTITKLRVKLYGGVTDGDAIFRFFINGVEQAADLTVPDGDDEIEVSGLSYAVTDDDFGQWRIIATMPTALPTAPYGLYIYYDGVGGSGDVATDAIFDAKGDLAVGTGANTAAKLTVGANDTIAMAASGETTGIKWATPTEVRTALALVVGTNVQAYDADLAQIAGLVDPNADRLLFWDDSAGSWAHLTLGTNLSITGTTINASGGGASDFDDIVTNGTEIVIHDGNVVYTS